MGEWLHLLLHVLLLLAALVVLGYSAINFRASKRNLDVACELRDAELRRVRGSG